MKLFLIDYILLLIWISSVLNQSILKKLVFITGIKMELGDKAVGALLTIVSLSIFTYYTFWVIILVSFVT